MCHGVCISGPRDVSFDINPFQRSGMVVFDGAESVQAALRASKSRSVVEWSLPESDEPIGVKGEEGY